MLKNPNVLLVGTQCYKMDEKGDIFGKLNLPTNFKCIKIYLESGIMPFCNPSLFVKKEVFEVIGYYRNIYAQDYDFVLRCFCKGMKMVNLPEVLFAYRIHYKKFRITHSKRYVQFLTAKFLLKQYKKAIWSLILMN